MMAPIDAENQDYDIFIHERGQFWPRSDMFSYGQPKVVSVRGKKEIEILFSSKVSSKMKTSDHACVEDKFYSFTECIQDGVRMNLHNKC